MAENTDPYLAKARELVYEAGRRVMELFRMPLVATRKKDLSPVTNADHASNDLLRAGLRRAFPSHAVLSEETGYEGPSEAEWVWLLDPLDGTKAFVEGVPGFSVMAALLRKGEPRLGVVYDPRDQHLYEALRGEGAFQWVSGRRRPIRVSARKEWLAMPMIVSTGFPPALRSQIEDALQVRFLDPVNSVGVKVGYLVRQLADLYVNHHPVHYWDTAAPQVILEEAGGRMTSWDGSPLTYHLKTGTSHAQATVASNGRRHDDLIAALGRLTRA